MATRSGAERDAITIEIGYAVVSAALAAALVFGAVAGPAFFFELPRFAAGALVYTGAGLAALAFVARVVHVLWRFTTRPAQPARPGRTGPGSWAAPDS